MDWRDYQEKIAALKKMFEKHNVPLWSMNFASNFAPQELLNEFDETIKEISCLTRKDEFEVRLQLLKDLEKVVKLDPNRIQKYHLWDIAVEEKDNIVFERYPELESLQDEDGLINLPFHSDLNKNGFRYKAHHLIFPDYFANNFHFTEWFITNWKGDFPFKVCFDYNRLGLPETRRDMFLAAHWQGPKTIENLKRSFEKCLLTEKRSVLNGQAKIDDKTEFLFFKDNDKWHLQIEELIPSTSGFKYEDKIEFRGTHLSYHTRYLHAILNSNLDKCYHLDGAIRTYSTFDNWEKRNKTTLKNSDIRDLTHRYKIFRIDSDKGIICFQEIIGLFFISNPYVTEFFEGESDFTKDVEKTRTSLMEMDLKSRGWLV